MTLFGRTLGGEEIASLVFLLTALVIWVMAYRGEKGWENWFRNWEAGRKARREAEIAREGGGDTPPASPDEPRGPWS